MKEVSDDSLLEARQCLEDAEIPLDDRMLWQLPRWRWYGDVGIFWKEITFGIGLYLDRAQLLWISIGPVRLIAGRECFNDRAFLRDEREVREISTERSG